MTKQELLNLRIGNKVVITNHGKNKGKMGIVNDIIRGPFGAGMVYIEPIDCKFEFTHKNYHTTNDEGYYAWNYYSIGYPKIRKPTLVIFRFKVYTDYNSMFRSGVISTNEDDARKIIYDETIKTFDDDDILIELEAILPMIEGTII